MERGDDALFDMVIPAMILVLLRELLPLSLGLPGEDQRSHRSRQTPLGMQELLGRVVLIRRTQEP